MADIHISVDKGRCIMSGNCTFVAADVFDQDDDGFVELLTSSVAAENAENVRDAARRCPGAAIVVD